MHPTALVQRFLRPGRSRIAGLAALVVLALCITGCSDFYTAPTGVQQNVIGSVDVSTVICLDGFDANSNSAVANFNSPTYSPNTDCTANTASGSTSTTIEGNSEGELLVGYLVPNGSVAPTTLTSPDLSGVTFTQDADYSNYLTANETTPSGEYWVGYISTDTTLTNGAQLVHLDAAFTLPEANGTPYQGPFATQEVVGDRADGNDGGNYTTTLDPNRPLNCSETDMFTPDGGIESETIYTTGCVNDMNSVSVATRDLAIQAPTGAATVQAGTSAEVPFSLLYAGTADSTATFSLTGSSDNGAISANPTDSTFTPTDNSTTNENVNVAVPASLAPGTYHVTLTAVDSDPSCIDQAACTRTATATITVTAAAPTTTTPGTSTTTPGSPTTTPSPTTMPVAPTTTPVAPIVTPMKPLVVKLLDVSRPKLVTKLLKYGESVKLSCNQACKVKVQLTVYYRAIHRGNQYAGELHNDLIRRSTKIVIGQRIVTFTKAGTRTVKLSVTRQGAKPLKTASSILLGIETRPEVKGAYPKVDHKRWITVHGKNILHEINVKRHQH